MSRPTLSWTVEPGGIQLTCTVDGEPVPFEQWGRRSDLTTGTGIPVRVAPILALVDAGRAEPHEDGTVWIPEANVAEMRPGELEGLGLPPAAPFTLRLEKSGLLTDRAFSVQASLIRPGGQPVVGPRIVGPVLHVGERRYTLLNPLFTAMRAAEGLNTAPDMESRGPYLERLQQCLPENALTDDYLKYVHIARADTFTVLPRVDYTGTVDFDMRPGRVQPADAEAGDMTPEVSAALPEAREAEWNRQFRNGASVRQTYAAGSGHYLVLGDSVRDALAVAKRVQQSSPETRAAFVRNPRAFFRKELGDSVTEEALEALFWESGEYGARVREVGLWQPKVLPFIRRSSQKWMPPEEMGIRIGDQLVRIAPDELDGILAELQEAREEGKPVISHAGHQIPVSDDVISALQELAKDADPRADSSGHARDEEPSKVSRIAVLISDNLNSLEFQRDVTARPGKVGGLPNALRTRLYSFQKEGLEWLQTLWVKGAPGGLLADDMGLGKTVQALAFLAWVRELSLHGQAKRKPILIVGPTGLLRNWVAEHEIHLDNGGLGGLFEAHGSGIRGLRRTGSRSSELESGIPVLDVDLLANNDCVLTTYETLRDYQHSFAKVRWGVAVLDEVQKVKNPAALVTEATKAITADFTVALTGTPVENHLSDLWCVTDAVQPGRLGALKDFVNYYLPDGAVHQGRMRELKSLLIEHDPAPMLRRMKQDHLPGLPEISVHITRAEMPARQAKAYDDVIVSARGASGNKGAMLKALQRLRSVSLHPAAEFDGNHQAFIDASARLKDTIRILDTIASKGEKALVFVEAVALQGVLAELLQRRYSLAAPPIIVNGSVEGSKRKSRVDTFQASPGYDVMILSPRAAGVGLTIVEANHVIHLSRWWNPAVEDQATDRVYRIGQRRPVHIYTPLAVHPHLQDASFDVQLHELLTRKRELSRHVLAPPMASEPDLAELYRGAVQDV